MREILFRGFHKEENGKETIYIDGQAIQDLNMHCDNCPDEIFSLCNRFCAYEDEKTALCCQPRFENMKVKEVEKIKAIFDKEVNDNE